MEEEELELTRAVEEGEYDSEKGIKSLCVG